MANVTVNVRLTERFWDTVAGVAQKAITNVQFTYPAFPGPTVRDIVADCNTHLAPRGANIASGHTGVELYDDAPAGGRELLYVSTGAAPAKFSVGPPFPNRRNALRLVGAAAQLSAYRRWIADFPPEPRRPRRYL